MLSNPGRRIRVGVFLGGASGEREISLASGRMIADHLPRDRYDVVLFDTLALMAGNPKLSTGLAQKARTLLVPGRAREQFEAEHGFLPAAMQREIQSAADAAAPATEAIQVVDGERRIDVAFIALHGLYGEDGTLQGMLDLIGIPYVGSGVLASAVAMDKTVARKILAADEIAVPRGVVIEREAVSEDTLVRAQALAPAFVKPSRQGSSWRTKSAPRISRPMKVGPPRSWRSVRTAPSTVAASPGWT